MLDINMAINYQFAIFPINLPKVAFNLIYYYNFLVDEIKRKNNSNNCQAFQGRRI